MRELKFHERKLLKKVNFLQWKNEHNHREVEVMRRYHLQGAFGEKTRAPREP
jgi:U3 small nucleolar ribonucleoprotein protein IMP3|tara:strand:- start:141 stop:296 length:156 start_codon:yes stop_codon:yes gene_type:complete